MSEILSEFLKFLFQPPVLILFCLAIAGLSMMLRDRSDARDRINLEWRVREAFYRHDAGLSEDLIARMRKKFYERYR